MKPVKNVLLVTKEFQSEFQKNVGGTGVFYKNFAEALVKKNINVLVFGSSKKPYQLKQNQLSICYVQDYFKKYKWVEFLRSITGKVPFLEQLHFKIYNWEVDYLNKELQKFIRNQEIDIIETHDWEGISRTVENLNIPYVVRCHGSWSVLHHFFGYGASKGKMHNEYVAFKNVDHCISISKSGEKMLQSIFGEKNYKLIYNGIDINEYLPLKNDIIPKSIFFLGNISSEKGADKALDVFFEVIKKVPNASLHYIGKNTKLTEELIAKATSTGLKEKIFFYGRKERNEVKSLISKAEVVIFPSQGETFGLALTEVMAMQKPIVCSNLDVFREIVQTGFNGLIGNTIDDFADKIIEIFDNEDFANYIAINARETIIGNFSQQKMVDDSILYYQDIINNISD